jgi:hypothetical protein
MEAPDTKADQAQDVEAFPQWTTRITDDDIGGEDHLGVEGAAQSYQQWLVPGIITTTDHARYYGFYSWILYRFIQDQNSSRLLADFRGPYFKRHEVAFIAGCYSHHQEAGGLTGVVGGNSARKIWESGNPISLDAPYFKDRLGGFGQYYRSAMQAMGLVGEQEGPRWVYQLTHRGKALAEAFEASIRNTTYFQDLTSRGQLTLLDHATAIEYGSHACLCAGALGHGADCEPLIDAFFRFDEQDRYNPHVRRRLTLGLILDLVKQSGDAPLDQTIRPALYLGEYRPGLDYQPAPVLCDWYARWRMVQIRHSYTTALQSLWALFLDHLRENPNKGFSFAEFMDWVIGQLPPNQVMTPVSDYLDQLCAGVSLDHHWTQAHQGFERACRRETGCDEYSLYRQIEKSRRNPEVLLGHALRILCQLFLRFYGLHQENGPIWQELAAQPRMPLGQFFNDLLHHLRSPAWTVREMIDWLYREYVVGQHEFIALLKLRQQQYNTFKYYYQDGVFTWAFNPTNYREPLRYPSLRLVNGLTILVDLGLVEKDGQDVCHLTDDGETGLERVLEAGCGN